MDTNFIKGCVGLGIIAFVFVLLLVFAFFIQKRFEDKHKKELFQDALRTEEDENQKEKRLMDLANSFDNIVNEKTVIKYDKRIYVIILWQVSQKNENKLSRHCTDYFVTINGRTRVSFDRPEYSLNNDSWDAFCTVFESALSHYDEIVDILNLTTCSLGVRIKQGALNYMIGYTQLYWDFILR